MLTAPSRQHGVMSIFTDHPSLRWAAPVTAAALVIGGTSAAAKLSASADSDLPDRTAAQLLTDVRNVQVAGVSGTVVETAALGIPALPGDSGGHGSGQLASLISGTNTMKVWSSGKDQTRIAVLGRFGESDVIRNGQDVWVWSSKDRSALHTKLPASAKDDHDLQVPSTPHATAEQLLSKIGSTTSVRNAGTVTVAGRAAYDLEIKPKQRGSLVSKVRVAIDGQTHVPLRVQVYSTKQAKPAFDLGFTSVSFGRPDAGQFSFNPPPGTKVTERTLPTTKTGKINGAAQLGSLLKATSPEPLGDGWTSVLSAKVPNEILTGKAKDGKGPNIGMALKMLPRVEGSWGSGRQLSGTLFTVLITDDGRLFAGAVTPQVLYAAAAR